MKGFLFDSAGMQPEAAFDDYARLYAGGADVERSGGPFAATVSAWRLDGMILFDRRLTGITQFRDAERVRRDGFDHLVLHAVLAGMLLGSEASGFARADAGEAVILDTRLPTRQTPVDAHLITVSIARHRLTPVADRFADLHGRVLRPPDTLLLFDYLQALVRHAEALTPTASLSRAFVELLSGTLEGMNGPRVDRERAEVSRREAVVQFMAANLHRADLSADTIGEALGLSRSALYRLMEPQGGVTQFLRKKRLAAVRDALERGSGEGLTDLAQRYGFGDEAQLRRLFTAAYGVSPSAFHAEIRAISNDAAALASRRWEGWMSELS